MYNAGRDVVEGCEEGVSERGGVCGGADNSITRPLDHSTTLPLYSATTLPLLYTCTLIYKHLVALASVVKVETERFARGVRVCTLIHV